MPLIAFMGNSDRNRVTIWRTLRSFSAINDVVY